MAKRNARINAGFILFGLGWIGLIYGLYQEYLVQKAHEECARLNNCWEFTTSGFGVSPYTLGGVLFMVIGGLLILLGKRALGKTL